MEWGKAEIGMKQHHSLTRKKNSVLLWVWYTSIALSAWDNIGKWSCSFPLLSQDCLWSSVTLYVCNGRTPFPSPQPNSAPNTSKDQLCQAHSQWQGCSLSSHLLSHYRTKYNRGSVNSRVWWYPKWTSLTSKCWLVHSSERKLVSSDMPKKFVLYLKTGDTCTKYNSQSHRKD